MGQDGFRVTVEEAARLRRDFSWIGFFLQCLIGFAFSIILLYGLVRLAYRIVTLPLRLLCALRPKRAHVKDIFVDPKPGASWFWWTYVTFVTDKREKTLHLRPIQAVRLIVIKQIKEADAGKLSYFGRSLIAWRPLKESPNSSPQVFLSYSQERSAEAQLVANILKGQGLQVWQDTEKLEPGDSLPSEIEKSIRNAQVFLPLLCPAYVASEWCQRELELACKEIPEQVLPIKVSAEEVFIPAFMQDSLNAAGEPLFLDLNDKRGLDHLREIGERIRHGDSPRPAPQS